MAYYDDGTTCYPIVALDLTRLVLIPRSNLEVRKCMYRDFFECAVEKDQRIRDLLKH